MATSQNPQNEKLIAGLKKTVSDPKFIDLIQEVNSKPKDQRNEYAKKVANVNELKNRGIPVPEGFRLTTRIFEDPEKPSSIYDEEGNVVSPNVAVPVTVCISLGVGELVYVCVSYGN